MKAKQFLAHVITSQPRKRPDTDVHQAISKHIRETLSREKLSKTLKEHRMQEQRSKAIAEHLRTLEDELNAIKDTHGERVRRLQSRVQELRKKL